MGRELQLVTKSIYGLAILHHLGNARHKLETERTRAWLKAVLPYSQGGQYKVLHDLLRKERVEYAESTAEETAQEQKSRNPQKGRLHHRSITLCRFPVLREKPQPGALLVAEDMTEHEK